MVFICHHRPVSMILARFCGMIINVCFRAQTDQGRRPVSILNRQL